MKLLQFYNFINIKIKIYPTFKRQSRKNIRFQNQIIQSLRNLFLTEGLKKLKKLWTLCIDLNGGTAKI